MREYDSEQSITHRRVPSAAIYAKVRQAIQSRTFKRPDRWSKPSAKLEAKDLSAALELRLNASQLKCLHHDLKKLTDSTVDVLEAALILWIERPNPEMETVRITPADILKLRGLKPLPTGGYSIAARAAVIKEVEVLSRMWLKIDKMILTQIVIDKRGREVRKRVPYVDEVRVLSIEARRKRKAGRIACWNIRPGEAIRQTLLAGNLAFALLPLQVLHYHPRQQYWEKRLARYLYWLWRIQKTEKRLDRPHKIGRLLDAIGCKEARPQYFLKRLKKALKRLKQDGLIAGWQFLPVPDSIDERYWMERLREQRLQIYPPRTIREAYSFKRQN